MRKIRYIKTYSADLITGGYYVAIMDSKTGKWTIAWGPTKKVAEKKALECLKGKTLALDKKN